MLDLPQAVADAVGGLAEQAAAVGHAHGQRSAGETQNADRDQSRDDPLAIHCPTPAPMRPVWD